MSELILIPDPRTPQPVSCWLLHHERGFWLKSAGVGTPHVEQAHRYVSETAARAALIALDDPKPWEAREAHVGRPVNATWVEHPEVKGQWLAVVTERLPRAGDIATVTGSKGTRVARAIAAGSGTKRGHYVIILG